MGYLYTQIARFLENAVIETGQYLSISVAGVLFLGFPVSFSLSAYIFTILGKEGIAISLAIMAALVSSLLLGVLFALLYRHLSNDGFVVFTLASVLAFDALLRSWDSVTGGVLGIAGVPKPEFLSNFLSLVLLQCVIAAVFLVIGYLVLKSPLGRMLRAHKENTTLLDSLGCNSRTVGSLAIIFASFTSAVGGIITVWRIQFLDPTLGGIPLLLSILTISILAVQPKIRWMIAATLIITLLPEVLRFFPFPSTVIGHLRLLFYSSFLIVLVYRFSSRYTSEKRFI